MYLSSRRFVAAAIVVTLFALVALQPQSAGAQSSNPIANVALSKVGGHGGQCKVFVQNVVRQATGINLGSGYRQPYLNAGVEVHPANARPGDILQISNPSNHERFHSGYHTAIVIENLGNGSYRVVDSNWGGDQRVRDRIWTPRPASHLRLYAYRVGGGSSTNASAPTSNASSASGGTATVAAGASCLYLRTGAGVGNAALDCLPTGTTLNVLSGPVYANGYTWHKVSTPSGQQGWVAAEYLR